MELARKRYVSNKYVATDNENILSFYINYYVKHKSIVFIIIKIYNNERMLVVLSYHITNKLHKWMEWNNIKKKLFSRSEATWRNFNHFCKLSVVYVTRASCYFFLYFISLYLFNFINVLQNIVLTFGKDDDF